VEEIDRDSPTAAEVKSIHFSPYKELSLAPQESYDAKLEDTGLSKAKKDLVEGMRRALSFDNYKQDRRREE